MAVECIENEKDGGRNGRAHRKVRLELDLTGREDVAVVAGEVAELVLPVLLGRDEKVPWQQRRPKMTKQRNYESSKQLRNMIPLITFRECRTQCMRNCIDRWVCLRLSCRRL